VIVKRSVSLRGHRTSVSLEPEFFAELERIAAARTMPLAGLINEIDAGRASGCNLSSALRLHVLQWLKRTATG
jgi:predicted DNA-binding ribbon-helix-helix protein